MRTARKVPINPRAAGVGQITATRAATSQATPNPNAGLERFLVTDSNGNWSGNGSSIPVFDARAWARTAKANPAWNLMSWADQSWSDMSWADQSWATMSWADQSWSDMSWADMSWADMSWADSSQEDAAEGDTASGTDGYVAPTDAATVAASDPDLAVPVDPAIPAALVPPDATAPVTATAKAAAVPAPPALLP
jgi:hypothetical protein